MPVNFIKSLFSGKTTVPLFITCPWPDTCKDALSGTVNTISSGTETDAPSCTVRVASSGTVKLSVISISPYTFPLLPLKIILDSNNESGLLYPIPSAITILPETVIFPVPGIIDGYWEFSPFDTFTTGLLPPSSLIILIFLA